ncbi:hypothetical protein ACOMHN_027015 [Nucella lapillus]
MHKVRLRWKHGQVEGKGGSVEKAGTRHRRRERGRQKGCCSPSTGDIGGWLAVRKAGGGTVLENGGCPQTTEIFLCFRHPPLHDRRRGRWCPIPSALRRGITAGSSVDARDRNDFSYSLV